jgi:hypothetical protein
VLRIDTGKWRTDPEELNAGAAVLGTPYNTTTPGYIEFEPTKFLRPYDLAKH